ncbi:oxygen sensor histidine kinase NreB [Flavobacteriaceae bacterium UJ101]|nr:oxygen sensor histidine kinase NreB [Flavobacteriaceae bacterium UJ101]
MLQKSIWKIVFLLCFYTVISAQSNLNKDAFNLIEKANQSDSLSISTNFLYQAIKKASKIPNDTLLTRAYYNLYIHHYNHKLYDSNEYFLQKALFHAKRGHFYEGVEYCYEDLGLVMKDQKNYTKALYYFQKALNIYHQHKVGSFFLIHTKIGELNALQSNFKESLYHYKKAKNNIQFNDSVKQIKLNKAIGSVFFLTKKYDSAQFFFQKAIDLDPKIKEPSIHINYINTLIKLNKPNTLVYIHNYLKQLEQQNLPKDKDFLFMLYLLKGNLFLQLKQYNKAKKAYELSEKHINDQVSKRQELMLYLRSSKLEEKIGDYKKSLKYFKKMYHLDSILYYKEKTAEFDRIRTEYEVDNKDQQIELLNKEKEVEALRKKQIILGSLGLLVFLGIVFWYRSKTQNLKKKQEIERLEKEKELEQANALLKGQDQERNRIAKEIHDGVGAQLAGLKLNLEKINQKYQDKNLKSISSKLENSFSELRSISHNLSINYIQDHSLAELLTKLKQYYQKQSSFSIELSLFPKEDFEFINQIQKHHLYRIIQELLNNTRKHASATEVSISITKQKDNINLFFEDNGKGFNVSLQPKGIGLQNIEERVESLNGELSIDSQLSRGSIIVINIPV